jgi:hypothetical protein
MNTSRYPMNRQCTGKLPGYRAERTRFGDGVGSSRVSPLTRLGVSGQFGTAAVNRQASGLAPRRR